MGLETRFLPTTTSRAPGAGTHCPDQRPRTSTVQDPGWMLAELSLRGSSAQRGRVSTSKSECPQKAGPLQCPPGKEPHQVQGVGPTGLTELPGEGLRLRADQGFHSRARPGSKGMISLWLLWSLREAWPDAELAAPKWGVPTTRETLPSQPRGPPFSTSPQRVLSAEKPFPGGAVLGSVPTPRRPGPSGWGRGDAPSRPGSSKQG